MEKDIAILNAKSFDELLDIEYGKVGTALRDRFEENAHLFIINEMEGRDDAPQTNPAEK